MRSQSFEFFHDAKGGRSRLKKNKLTIPPRAPGVESKMFRLNCAGLVDKMNAHKNNATTMERQPRVLQIVRSRLIGEKGWG